MRTRGSASDAGASKSTDTRTRQIRSILPLFRVAVVLPSTLSIANSLPQKPPLLALARGQSPSARQDSLQRGQGILGVHCLPREQLHSQLP